MALKTYTLYRIDLRDLKVQMVRHLCAPDDKEIAKKCEQMNAFSEKHKFDDINYFYRETTAFAKESVEKGKLVIPSYNDWHDRHAPL
jgi:hypothetical protein